MPHSLPPLPYSYRDLEPHIDAQTMEIHHTKHHQAYIDKLNAAISGHSNLESMSVENLLRQIMDIPEDIRTAVQNHGGGHANHSLFWKIMKPQGGGEPEGDLADALKSTFGGFSQFKDKFSAEAVSLFGSGWAWLISDKGTLKVISTPNQDSPLMEGSIPLLGLDVWEHAYYLKYQNRRPDYIEAWWNVVNWNQVLENFKNA